MTETTPDKQPDETPETTPEIAKDLVSMREASTKLGVSIAKLSRLASTSKIYSEIDPFDNRVRLVDMIELKKLFPQEKRRKSK